MNLLIISASLNPESYSRTLAREARRVLVDAGRNVTFLDLRDYPLPLCDGDKAYEHENVRRVNAFIAAADGIIVASPIYNYGANAALKNLIELTGKGWENKIASFLCTAGGSSSYMGIMALANSLMLDFRTVIVPRFVYATGASFAGETITDAKIAARVADCAHETARIASALRPE
jgi:Predicted flavoprotein